MTTLRQAAELALEAMKDFDYDKRLAAIETVELALAESRYNELQELNQTPKAKLKWVGLTDDEKHLFSSFLDYKPDFEVFEAIEAKLKEKNT